MYTFHEPMYCSMYCTIITTVEVDLDALYFTGYLITLYYLYLIFVCFIATYSVLAT